MKKKPTKLEAKVAELEKRLALFEKTQMVGKAEPSIKEPEKFEDCLSKSFHISYRNTIHPEIEIPNKRVKQLAAIAKMMTVADALNHLSLFNSYWCPIVQNGKIRSALFAEATQCLVRFSSQHACEKAIKILGEETIKTAYGL